MLQIRSPNIWFYFNFFCIIIFLTAQLRNEKLLVLCLLHVCIDAAANAGFCFYARLWLVLYVYAHKLLLGFLVESRHIKFTDNCSGFGWMGFEHPISRLVLWDENWTYRININPSFTMIIAKWILSYHVRLFALILAVSGIGCCSLHLLTIYWFLWDKHFLSSYIGVFQAVKFATSSFSLKSNTNRWSISFLRR